MHKTAQRAKFGFFQLAWAQRLDEVTFDDMAVQICAARSFLSGSECVLTAQERARAIGFRELWLHDSQARKMLLERLSKDITETHSERPQSAASVPRSSAICVK